MKLLLVPGSQCFIVFDDADEFHFMLTREFVEKSADMAVFKADDGYANRRGRRLRKTSGCEQEASYEGGQRFEQSHGIDSTMIVLLFTIQGRMARKEISPLISFNVRMAGVRLVLWLPPFRKRRERMGTPFLC